MTGLIQPNHNLEYYSGARDVLDTLLKEGFICNDFRNQLAAEVGEMEEKVIEEMYKDYLVDEVSREEEFRRVQEFMAVSKGHCESKCRMAVCTSLGEAQLSGYCSHCYYDMQENGVQEYDSDWEQANVG